MPLASQNYIILVTVTHLIVVVTKFGIQVATPLGIEICRKFQECTTFIHPTLRPSEYKIPNSAALTVNIITSIWIGLNIISIIFV